jgi:hypothetical protein
MRILPGGNVGIGTSLPSQPLEVTGNAKINGNIIFSSGVNSLSEYYGINANLADSGGGQEFRVVNSASTFVMSITSAGKATIGNTDATYAGSLFTVQGGVAIGGGYFGNAAPSNGLLVQGNVGIGSSSPAATLDVNGYARLSLNSSAPATCSTSNEGAIALTHLAQACVCDTTPAWHILNTGTACSW